MDEHAGPVLGKASGDGGTNAAGGSGDEGEFVFERQGVHGILKTANGKLIVARVRL